MFGRQNDFGGVFGMDVTAVDMPIILGRFSGADVAGSSDGELIEAMVAARRLASRAQALELAAVAELVRRRRAEGEEPRVTALAPEEYVHDEIAEALTLTAASADDLVRLATGLTERLPATFAALADGDLDYTRARAMWHATAQVGDAVAAAIETRVLPRASGQTSGEIRAKVRRLVRRLDPDALARRRAHAETQRDLQLVETDDGTAHLTGNDLPADAAGAAYNRVNAIAAALKSDGDRRAIGQLRADVFLALLSGTLTTTEPAADKPGEPAAHAAIEPAAVRTSLSFEPAWTGTDDAVADLITRASRNELTLLTTDRTSGGLPLQHRELATLVTQAGERIAGALTELKAHWCVADHDQFGYRVPVSMRRLIEERDRRCCFPGCRRPVRYCDADHSIPYDQGGPTCPCNIAMLCRRHHRLKQTRGWHLQHLWPGVFLWVGPTGHWRITAPADRE